jgi:MFS family permease
MAAVLWGSGVSFGGVLAFLFAVLIVLPLLDVYRRAFGWRMAAYIAGVFYVAMVIAGMTMDVAFGALGWIPPHHGSLRASIVFAFDATFWLNGLAAALAGAMLLLARRQPPAQPHCAYHAKRHTPAPS